MWPMFTDCPAVTDDQFTALVNRFDLPNVANRAGRISAHQKDIGPVSRFEAADRASKPERAGGARCRSLHCFRGCPSGLDQQFHLNVDGLLETSECCTRISPGNDFDA